MVPAPSGSDTQIERSEFFIQFPNVNPQGEDTRQRTTVSSIGVNPRKQHVRQYPVGTRALHRSVNRSLDP